MVLTRFLCQMFEVIARYRQTLHFDTDYTISFKISQPPAALTAGSARLHVDTHSGDATRLTLKELGTTRG